ncbi:MAG: IS66 family transposase [Clostridiales bacterium]|nr:IS66 family transposase [Clostridiales bacterium]
MRNTEEITSEITRLNNTISSLFQENSQIINENIAITQELLELKAKNAYYEEQFKLMQKNRFGSKSEKSDKDQLSMFDDMLNEAESQSVPTLNEPDTEQITYTRKKRTKENLIKNLPVEEVHHEIPKEDRICGDCGHSLHDMGNNKRDEIEIIPAKAIVKRHITHKYSCRNCEETGTKTTIVKADSPKPLIKGSMSTPSTVSHIMTQKYMNAVPLYRQEKYMQSLGVNLSRQTMSNWLIKSSKYLEYMYKRLHIHLLGQDIIHADETPVQVLKEENRKAKQKSYMWLYKSGKYENQIVLYDYQPSRSHINPKTFLRGFKGYLQTDGYTAYEKLNNVTRVGCMAHVRRKFKDAMNILSEEYHKDSMAGIGLAYCNRLYSIEKKLKDMSLEERSKKRAELSLPGFEEFQKWVKEQMSDSLPKSTYGKAITYANNQLPKVKNYLMDPRLNIDNNSAERSIKPFVIGRKNWLFSNTPRGAKSSAIIYSIIETAKENNLRTHEYLKYLLTQLKDMESYSDEKLDKLLPWSEDLPESCRIPD